MLEFALSQETARTAPLLPPVEGREENPVFRFILFLLSQRKRNFLFLRVLRSMGQQCATPKVPTTPFCDQVVNLQALPSEEADPALALLCPVTALRIYVDRTRSFRSSDQLFICHGGQQKGKAVSKQDSGCRRLGVPISRRAMLPGGEDSLHSECCLLPCVVARRLSGRHLQSCGLGDTEQFCKILQSLH